MLLMNAASTIESLVEVPLKVTALPLGTTFPSQLSASDHLLVAPPPSHMGSMSIL